MICRRSEFFKFCRVVAPRSDDPEDQGNSGMILFNRPVSNLNCTVNVLKWNYSERPNTELVRYSDRRAQFHVQTPSGNGTVGNRNYLKSEIVQAVSYIKKKMFIYKTVKASYISSNLGRSIRQVLISDSFLRLKSELCSVPYSAQFRIRRSFVFRRSLYCTTLLSGQDFGHMGFYSVWEWDTSEVSKN